MTGIVDESGRALVRLHIKNPTDATEIELDVWIDTGFTGELVLPQAQVAALALPLGPAVTAALADGSKRKWTPICAWLNGSANGKQSR